MYERFLKYLRLDRNQDIPMGWLYRIPLESNPSRSTTRSPDLLFKYNIRIISKSEPYEENHVELIGSRIGTYVDYDLETTIAFKDGLPFPISRQCDYILSLGSGREVTLESASPTTFRWTKKVPLAESAHLLGVFQGGSKQEGSVKLEVNMYDFKTVTHSN